MAHLVFISHCGEDSWVAQRISDFIQSSGAKSFLDLKDIPIGSIFEQSLHEALEAADELLILGTPWAFSRPYVWLELGAAWFRRIPVVVLLHGISPSEFRAHASIPVALHERNLVSINEATRYFEELAKRT